MEFFDYDTIGKTDDEIMQMAINFEEGRAGVTRLFWACELYLLLAERGNNEAIVRLVSRCARTSWLPKHYTISSAWFDIVKEELDRRIEQNDAEACRILALCYLEGIGCEVQDDQAVALLKKAINLNDYRSLNTLGWMVGKGRFDEGEPEDYYYRKAADNGVTVSMLNLALDAPNNSQEERYWLEKAVNLNHPRACFILGNRYMEDSDTKRAVELYKKAAELGYWESYEKLAEAYRHGRGVDENVNLAVYWYCMYGDIDNDNNDTYSDYCYGLKEYVKENKDYIEKPVLEKFFVIAYRSRSILHNDYFIMLRNEYHVKRFHDNRHWARSYKRIPIIIAATYLNTVFFGDFEDGKDDIYDEDVLKWLEKGEAIEDGATISMYCEAISSGIGHIQNADKEIIEKLTKASELGFSRATYFLGEEYWKGEIVNKDRRKAFELIKTATSDCGGACLFMGNQYYYGSEIVERDYDLALYYWSLPERWIDSNGHAHKEEKYDECVNNQVVVYNSIPVKMDKVKAHILMEEIAHNSFTIKFNRAWMYQNGEGNYPKDEERALEGYSYSESDSDKNKAAVTRATYNSAYIRFSRGQYDEAVKSFTSLKLSEQSYYQATCLSTYIYYCGYYDESGQLVSKDESIFRLSMHDLYKRKDYSAFLRILFIRMMKVLLNHGRYGKKAYRNINMNGLKRILYRIGDIPLQLEPEDEDTEHNKSFIKTSDKIEAKEERLHILENYISNMKDVDNKKDYYESIANWYINNKDVIDSPIMIAYWQDKLKSSSDL